MSAAEWMTYCPHDGWEEHETESQARDALEGIVDNLRDEASDEGWHDSAGHARMVKVTEVASFVLRVTASARDDSPGGELCRERGWYFIWDGAIEDTEPAREGVSLIAAERLHLANRALIAAEIGRLRSEPEPIPFVIRESRSRPGSSIKVGIELTVDLQKSEDRMQAATWLGKQDVTNFSMLPGQTAAFFAALHRADMTSEQITIFHDFLVRYKESLK